MAHFAELDSNNSVIRVVVVGNADTADADGNEVEAIGQQFCTDLFGGTWVQTSYNGNMRGRYAGIGYTYNAALDAFIVPQPFPSWTLDAGTTQWVPPTPVIPGYYWDEDTLAWIQPAQTEPSWVWANDRWRPPTPYPDDGKVYDWDEDTTSWVEVE